MKNATISTTSFNRLRRSRRQSIVTVVSSYHYCYIAFIVSIIIQCHHQYILSTTGTGTGTSFFVSARLQQDGSCHILSMWSHQDKSILVSLMKQQNKNKNKTQNKNHYRWTEKEIGLEGYNYMAAAQMAMDHFNTRNHTVVPEIAHLTTATAATDADADADVNISVNERSMIQQCNVTLSATFTNDMHDELIAISIVLNETASRFNLMAPKNDNAASICSSDNDNNNTLRDSPSDSTTKTPPANKPQWERNKELLESLSSRPFCAVLGPSFRRGVGRIGSLTGALDLPQVFFGTDHTELNDPRNYPTNIGIDIPRDFRARMIVDYLQSPPLNRSHLAIIAETSIYSTNFIATLELAIHAVHEEKEEEQGENILKEHHLTTKVFEYTESLDGVDDDEYDELLSAMVKNLKFTGYHTFLFLSEDVGQLFNLIDKLDAYGLMEDDYLFIFLEEAFPPEQLNRIIGQIHKDVENDDKIMKFLKNSVLIARIGSSLTSTDIGANTATAASNFLRAWQDQNASMVERINAMSPSQQISEEIEEDSLYRRGYYEGEHDFFQTNLPPINAAFVYDSIMAIGIGMCIEQHQKQQNNGAEIATAATNEDNIFNNVAPATGADNNPNSSTTKTQKPKFHDRVSNTNVQSILTASFTGATGPVAFNTRDKTRIFRGLELGFYNLRSKTDPNGTLSFDAILTSTWSESVGFVATNESFIYRDGTMHPPEIDVEIYRMNFLSTWVRIAGLTLTGIVWLLCLVSAVLIYVMWEVGPIKAAQPFFLQLLLLGSSFMSASSFCLSFDDINGYFSNLALDIACSSALWMFFLGHLLIYSSLFSKLWRIDQVLQFRRKKVGVVQVMAPLVMLQVIAIALLISWTSVDPWVWRRVMIVEFPPESYGQCTSESCTYFFVPLAALVVSATSFTLYFTWKTKDIPKDFSDTSTIFYTIVAQLQAWFIGIPILIVLGDNSADATYLGRALLIFLFAVTPVVLVIVPKLHMAIQMKRHPDKFKKRKNVRVSGIFTGPPIERSSLTPTTAAPCTASYPTRPYSFTPSSVVSASNEISPPFEDASLQFLDREKKEDVIDSRRGSNFGSEPFVKMVTSSSITPRPPSKDGPDSFTSATSGTSSLSSSDPLRLSEVEETLEDQTSVSSSRLITVDTVVNEEERFKLYNNVYRQASAGLL